MTPQELAAEFPLGPDSLPQPGVPTGRLEAFTHRSRIFAGAVRDCWTYVPAQYDPARPACVMVVQDGADHLKPERRWHIPTVLDNLIHRGEMPVTIGIFINPGKIPSPVPGAAPRDNRSFEYDSLGDRYARFLLEEIIPEVGRTYRLRSDANSRCIMGGSSGAFCALNVAWERPEAIARVVSIVGSYTAMRGGHTLASRIRLTEPKPLRIFLQSGEADLNIFAGDWWTANLELRSALDYAGYEANHVWAKHAGHDEFHGSMVFPDALRWVWAGYPGAISAGVKSRQPVARLLVPGEGWREISGNYGAAGAMSVDAQGRVFFAGGPDSLWRVEPGDRAVKVMDSASYPAGLAAPGSSFAANGNRYSVEPAGRQICLTTPAGGRRIFPTGARALSAVKVTADQSQLVVTDATSRAAWLYSLDEDGSPINGAPYFLLATPPDADTSGAVDVFTSRSGSVFFATPLGIQFSLPNGGLIAGIIPVPQPGGATGVALGGVDEDQLVASCGGRVYIRRLRKPESLWT